MNGKVLIGCFIYTLTLAVDIKHYYNFFLKRVENSRKEKTTYITTKISKIVSMVKVFFSPVLIIPRLIRACLFFQYLCWSTEKVIFISLTPLIITFPSESLILLLDVVSMEFAFSLTIFSFFYLFMH